MPFTCSLIGAGPEYDRIGTLIQQLGVADCVEQMGPMPNDQLPPYLQRAAVFALPAVITANGDRDGIPVALMEAMACGVPSISTATAGIPELLRHASTGFLVPRRDAAALADALQTVLSDHELAAELGRNGRRAVTEEFDIRNTTERLRRLFQRAVGRENGTGRGITLSANRSDGDGG